MRPAARRLAGTFCVGLTAFVSGQQLPQIGDLSAPLQAKGPDRVHYASEPERAVAHDRDVLTLHFRVDNGFHINSHRPKGDLLIATELRVQAEAGVQVGLAEYPMGQPFHFAVDPKEVLDVYTGSFDVLLPVVTAKGGTYTLHGALRYQACDQAACYPVRALPVAITFTTK